MRRLREEEKNKSWSISMTDTEKNYHCQAFDGSITYTFRFLSKLMDDACRDGMLDMTYVADKLAEFKDNNNLT